MLLERNCSLLVRTDFSSDDAWQQVADEATQENEAGFRAYAEPCSTSQIPLRGLTWFVTRLAGIR